MSLSFSRLSAYRTCPRQFEYEYIKKLPRQIRAGESFGSSVHNTLKKWGEREIAVSGKRQAGIDQLRLFTQEDSAHHLPLAVETLLEFWHSSFIVEGYGTRVEADMARLRGEEIMQYFFDWWQQREHDVLFVEKGFSLAVDGQKITGRLDRVEKAEGGLKIIDYKTSAVRSQNQADADLQLSVYALACEQSLKQPCSELSFLFLSEEGVTEVVTARTAGQLQDAAKQIRLLEECITSGDFRPTPGREVCRCCPYSNVCDVAAV